MNESERLAHQLEKALEGGAWHGPSWREILKGVSREAALHRPLPSAHTVAEIVLHATTWHEVVRQRLLGESPQVPDDQDWPVPKFPDDAAWSRAVSRHEESGRALVETVKRFPAERLSEKRPGLEDTWFELVAGQLQHALYHAGQCALLKKAGKI